MLADIINPVDPERLRSDVVEAIDEESFLLAG